MDRNLLWPSEAARLLMISSTHVRRLFDAGQLRGVRGPGGYRFVNRESVVVLAQTRRQAGRSRKRRVAATQEG